MAKFSVDWSRSVGPLSVARAMSLGANRECFWLHDSRLREVISTIRIFNPYQLFKNLSPLVCGQLTSHVSSCRQTYYPPMISFFYQPARLRWIFTETDSPKRHQWSTFCECMRMVMQDDRSGKGTSFERGVLLQQC